MLPQQYCLRWRYHHSNLESMFSQLLEREAFCDVTLACEGKTIKAHKIVLSACSTYFETILSQYEEKDPILIMKDVKYVDIKCLVEFMYKGEINVDHCHLATLLKTAEELRIKGLAEVSWKDDENSNNGGDNGNNTNNNTNGGIPTSPSTATAALSQVATVMDSPNSQNSASSTTTPNATTAAVTPNNNNNKRKRGRPPIDDYDQAFQQPRIMNVTGNAADDNYNSNDAMSSSEHDLNIWEEESANEQDNDEHDAPPRIKIKKEIKDEDDQSNQSFTLSESKMSTKSSHSMGASASGQSFLTPLLEKEWPDVIKMNDYLNTGRRQQFWEEPFTKRVMDAIKTKNLEMKVAAELLGVSYGTLYGRYRDSYGCLKHPYRVRDFWTEQGPTDVLLKLKRKEITLFRAAEQLNVTPQTLSNYLISMSQLDNPDVTLQTGTSGSSGLGGMGHSYDESDDDDDDRQRSSTNNGSSSGTITGGNVLFKNLLNNSSNNTSNTSNSNNNGGASGANVSGKNNNSRKNSVLANCPDITIIKKEKPDVISKINNNSDHSDGNSSDHGK